MERNIILVGGLPGSGKSKLSTNTVKKFEGEITAAHISSGETVRRIGKGAIKSLYSQFVIDHLNSPRATKPIDDSVMFGIMSETISRHDDADLIISDGYPRYESQVNDTLVIAESNNRHVAGLLIVEADEKEILNRLLRRKNRDFTLPLTPITAQERIDHHKRTFDGTVMELYHQGVRFSHINTMGPPEEAATHSYLASKLFLSAIEPPEND